MAQDFAPAPTYADPVIVDEISRKSRFNPLWLKWFLDLAQFLSAAGAASGGVLHNNSADLQGGAATDYYHLTGAEHTALVTAANADAYHVHDHKNLENLQGGTTDEYYHLTATQHTDLTDAGETILHTHDHKNTTNLQGGTTNEYYHLTQDEHDRIMLSDIQPVAAVTVGASPFVFQNTHDHAEDVITNGGNMSLIEFSRNGTNYYTVAQGALVEGMFHLSPGDYIRVTYAVAPTMYYVTR